LFAGGGLAGTNGLQRHIPRVSRAITKVVNHVENLDQVTGYLEMLGKIHQQIGIEVLIFYTKRIQDMCFYYFILN
jgi:hypothetical protein